jgi:hypothetical protein
MVHLSHYLSYCLNLWRLRGWSLIRMSGFFRARKLLILVRGVLPFIRLKSPKTILSLPPELICEILLLVNAEDLCSIKLVRISSPWPNACAHRYQTTRMFYNATKSRQFWQRVLSSLVPVSSQPNFGKRLRDCTPQQMEHWGMKSLRIYERWAMDVPFKFRSCSFNYREMLTLTMTIEEAKLLPGGRWLVASTSLGRYLLYDLDSPSPQPQELFDPKEYDRRDKTPDYLSSCRIWINTAREDLCFRTVVWRWSGPMEGESPQFWTVSPNLFFRQRDMLRGHTYMKPTFGKTKKACTSLRREFTPLVVISITAGDQVWPSRTNTSLKLG